jgi:glycerol-3-phosphate dehydrogenase
MHTACEGSPASASPDPTEQQINRLLDDLNQAIPGFDVGRDDVLRVYSGLLPARKGGSAVTADRPVTVDHARTGGPLGLWSISGVKYTTARLVAEQTLRRVFASSGRDLRVRPRTERPEPAPALLASEVPPVLSVDTGEIAKVLTTVVDEEAVVYIDDLLHRRTEWTADPRRTNALVASVTRLLGRTRLSLS